MAGETIYALSSAPGKAGVAVVRVSGPGAFSSFQKLTGLAGEPVPRHALFKPLINPADGKTLDYALVLPFKGPESFTGEDVVEYHLHGSPAVLESVFSALSSFDAHRPADHGEFTRRAFENGKLDLTEAEAVADLIDAQTQAQAAQALAQMDGALSKLYEGWRARLIRAMAHVEAVIDFPDEDVPDSEIQKTVPALKELIAELETHLNDNRRGERLRDGVHIAILGAPNAGKSSLLNALAKRDAAIVSPMAGTTRDVIEVHLDIAGFPVILADTAGLRDVAEDSGHGSVESEGIRRALQRAQQADLRLLLFDGTEEKLDEQTLSLLDENSLVVINKCDSSHYRHPRLVRGSGNRMPAQGGHDVTSVEISCHTGQNINSLLSALKQKLEKLYAPSREAPSLTRARHRTALEDCVRLLQDASCASSPELMAEDIRLAARALGRITGRIDVEDLLDVIFRDFCIGK